MSKVVLNNLNKCFGDIVAVNNLNLDVRSGEFFSLLGPSGCGKTTTLRMIAGFEFPASGRIYFEDRDVTFLKTSLRNTGMVFQNFALFPHMTVFENVAFGLQARKVVKSEIGLRVKKTLDLVDLPGLASRKVTELSGGQQQRVALARAIVIEPEILLLDEPLSNLDAKLREQTRIEIRSLQQRLGITTIYVTHDQDEALSLSDRMAVMNHGVCQQVGTPEEIYQFPANEFVARFVGNSNILSGRVSAAQSGVLEIDDDIVLKFVLAENSTVAPGQPVKVSVRPESFAFTDGDNGAENVLFGKITAAQYAGATAEYRVAVGKQEVRVKTFVGEGDFARKPGASVRLRIPASQLRILTD